MKKFKLIDLTLIAFFVALITVCAWITIPIPSIPFTLQIFAVFAALFILGGKRGTISIVVYVLLGTVGVPVFTNFNAGLGALLGPTGGYLVGFILTGLLYWLLTHFLPKKAWAKIVSALAGLVICYVFGSIWFQVAYASSTGTIGFGAILLMCVIPYIIPDLAKIALAFAIAVILKKALPQKLRAVVYE